MEVGTITSPAEGAFQRRLDEPASGYRMGSSECAEWCRVSPEAIELHGDSLGDSRRARRIEGNATGCFAGQPERAHGSALSSATGSSLGTHPLPLRALSSPTIGATQSADAVPDGARGCEILKRCHEAHALEARSASMDGRVVVRPTDAWFCCGRGGRT